MTPAEVKAFNAGVEAAAKLCRDLSTTQLTVAQVVSHFEALKKPEREDK